ncbi:MAG: transcriptional regulator [Nanoarchaeota archaeon]|nr:transcriptional regulator [Nanoarchaeota archaeon]
MIPLLSLKYYEKMKYNRFDFYSWLKGKKLDRGKIKRINIPLWLLLEFSKIISNSKDNDNQFMIEAEQNIEYYTGWGKSNPILKPKLPLQLTPEMVSIIFHFVGDGHIGRKEVSSSYRQMDKEGLTNFLLKLNNIFGEFEYGKKEFEDGRLNIPKIITEFYTYYFNLPNTDTFQAYIPQNIKSLDKEFLVAGLVSFIIDEGSIGEVITIYSKNKTLLRDIREISIKCDYICNPIREKRVKGKFDVYRFGISSKSYLKLNEDIFNLKKDFPICGLAHKTKKLEISIKRKLRGTAKGRDGATKENILNLLKDRSYTIAELVEILNVGDSSIKEHLWKLEKENKITRAGNRGRNLLWSIK